MTPRLEADVAIVGGGPAGCATALALAAHAPGLRTVLVEASTYAAPRLGETLPPIARRLLEHLGAWSAFLRQAHRETHGTAAAWGTAAPQDHDYLFTTSGHHGWQLDRQAFDAMLAAEAEARGAVLLRSTRAATASRIESAGGGGGGWLLRLRGSGGGREGSGGSGAGSGNDGGELAARFLVDATGATAAIARRGGARAVAADRLTAYVRYFAAEEGAAETEGAAGAAGDPRTLVEAFAEGWWYTAGLPGGRRIAACMTDADLGRRLGLADPERWWRALAATSAVRERLAGARRGGPVLVRTARTRLLDPVAGADWLATGDAAALFDPLSSQGVAKALRSGIFAAYAAGDLLAQGDPSGLARYARFVADEFASYRRTRERYYGEERRWPESPFWRRRRPPPTVPPI